MFQLVMISWGLSYYSSELRSTQHFHEMNKLNRMSKWSKWFYRFWILEFWIFIIVIHILLIPNDMSILRWNDMLEVWHQTDICNVSTNKHKMWASMGGMGGNYWGQQMYNLGTNCWHWRQLWMTTDVQFGHQWVV